MKILLFTIDYPPFKGGVSNYYNSIVKFWPEPNSIIVLHNNSGNLLKNWLYPKWLPAFWHLRQTIKREKIKHILVGHILPLGTVTYIITRFIKTSYSVILHGMDFTYALRNQRKKWLAKKILNNAKYIICGNSYTAGLVKKFVGDKQEDKVGVVNPGIFIRKQKAESPLRLSEASRKQDLLIQKYNLQNKIVLFSIGRLVKRKGFDKVIEALPMVLKKAPNLVYVIAGTGPDEEYLKNIVGTLHCDVPTDNKIIFLGEISDEEKWAWLNLCDIFIMPARTIRRAATNGAHSNNKISGSDFEGFGIVYLEANLCNKPVIAGDSGGVRDAVEDHVNGILVDPDNTEAIAEGILELALNQILRQKLGEQGWRRAIEKFNWEKQARKIFQLINRSYKSY